MVELGQKVKFKKELKKGENLERDDSFSYYKYKNGIKWGTIEHEEKEGIICGKRTISYKGHVSDGLGFVTEEYKQVYLVVTNMRGFHRVPEEWIKEE